MFTLFRRFLLAVSLLLPVWVHAQCVSLTTPGVTYSQNFDTLALSGTSSTLPTGWLFSESGTGANTLYTAGTGSSTSGDTYSFGSAGNSERALGTVLSGSVTSTIGACFTNNTGATLGTLNIAYTGEQWRLGATGRADRLDFSYSLDATSLSSGTWTPVTELVFSSPTTAGTVGALDGNAAANRAALSKSIAGLSIPNGATFYVRWLEFNPSGSDDGLAVDDFTLTPVAQVILPNLTVNSVSQSEGNSGTTTFTFTVSLSMPAGAGGVTFDIATQNGTATAGVDYVAKALTGQNIAEGLTSYTFSVDANGDTDVEGNETFLVNVTNINGANATSPTGTGTIVNDDAGANLTVNNVSQAEGNSGTTIFTFTVSLSAPAPAGGVTFDIATADGTASAATDYVAKTLSGQVIAAGSTSYTFDVVVNGDTTAEADESFFVDVTNVSGAIPLLPQGKGTILTDDITRIHSVQGSGTTSPLSGQVVTVEGIVTQISQGAGSLLGFFIQEPEERSDSDPLTSEGIFIFTNTVPAAVAIGDMVRVTGQVTEFGTAPNTLTEIGTPAAAPTVQLVSNSNGLPNFVTVSLPVLAAGELERYEGMRVRFSQTLTVSDHFSLAQYGELGLTANGRSLQPTNVLDPNDADPAGTSSAGTSNVAAITAMADLNARSYIILDGSPTTYAATVPFLDPATNTIRLGSTVSDVTGVMGQLGGVHRVYPDVAPVFTYAARPATPPAVGGNVKVGSMNVLNYFNGDGAGAGFPTSRGANTAAEFARQRAKVIAAINGLGADVVGILEMENDGDGATSALQDLVNGLNAAAGAGTWAFVPTPAGYTSLPGGSDLIRPAILYKPAVVGLVGDSVASADSAFTNARAPIAQTFRLLSNDERFTLVVNHFKSKSSGGASGLDADQNDGQGAYNNQRKLQASALIGFLATLTNATPRIITMGDFNAYEQEDPIDVLRAGGLATLVNGNHSYMFDGQSGSLDHALGTPALVSVMSGAGHWHINADEPVFLDYNVENKNTAGCTTACTLPDYFAATPYRASDHDPVVVGLQLDAAQCAIGTWSATGNAPCTPAAAGYFVPVAGATSQTACSTGTYQPNTGAASCLPAAAGYFVDTTASPIQTACAVGTYQPNTGAQACLPAAAGHFVDSTASPVQSACALGSFQPNTGAQTCLPAAAGYFVGVIASPTQTACSIGNYQPQSGSSFCLPAGAGYFVAQAASPTQTPCAEGTFQPNTGSAACMPAEPGNFVAVTASPTQTPCSPGSYQPANGQSSCVLASPGFYVPGSGATTQTACPSGTTSQSSGAIACEPIAGLLTLSVSRMGPGVGTVTSAPAGISCGANCSDSFASGTAMVLTATPSPGSLFGGWSGVSCTGGNSGLTCGFTLSSATTVTATFAPDVSALIARNDLNDDGKGDIVWRNGTTGENYFYPMDGRTILSSEGPIRSVPAPWVVAGVGDFDGDGKADLLWRNTSTGENYVYFMDGKLIKATEGFIRSVPTNWVVGGVADFDGDGKADILWRNSTTGENYLYFMDGRTIKSTEGYLRTVATAWAPATVADFDGDGKADILWRNSTTGENYLYPMDGKLIKATEGYIRSVATNWIVAGSGDFTGDGKADILWRNTSTGENYLYPMDGRAILGTEGFIRSVPTNWIAASVTDYDGDGKVDILWRNTSTGENYIYPMDGRTIKATEGFIRSVPTSWSAVTK